MSRSSATHLFTTNIRRVAHGVTKGAANTGLLKVNQIGTISEALEMIQYAYKFGYAVMPSDSEARRVHCGLCRGHQRRLRA